MARFFGSALVVLCFFLLPLESLADGKVSLENEWGFVGIIFETPNGRVLVRAPEGLLDGDVFAGSYRLDPSGDKPKKKKKNLEKLLKLELTINDVPLKLLAKGGYRADAKAPFVRLNLTGKKINLQATVAVSEKSGRGLSPPKSGGNEMGSNLPETASGQDAQDPHSPLDCPLFAQGSWPMKIQGPQTGNPLETKVLINGLPADWMAVSPREVVIRTPMSFSGPGKLQVQNQGTSQSCESFGMLIDLGVGSIVLHKGQTTVLSVQVSGLKGLDRPLPLRLVNDTPGGITMEGGPLQLITIRPDQVAASGIWTTQRTLTGLRQGTFGVTASLDREGELCARKQQHCENKLAGLEKSQQSLEQNVEKAEQSLTQARKGLSGWQKSLLAQQALFHQCKSCEKKLQEVMGGHFDFTLLEGRTTAYAPKTSVYPERQEQVDEKFSECQVLWKRHDEQQKASNRELLKGDDNPAVKQAKDGLIKAQDGLKSAQDKLKEQADRCQALAKCS